MHAVEMRAWWARWSEDCCQPKRSLWAYHGRVPSAYRSHLLPAVASRANSHSQHQNVRTRSRPHIPPTLLLPTHRTEVLTCSTPSIKHSAWITRPIQPSSTSLLLTAFEDDRYCIRISRTHTLWPTRTNLLIRSISPLHCEPVCVKYN